MLLMFGPSPAEIGTKPVAGSQCRLTEKTMIPSNPRRKVGQEKPNIDTATFKRSRTPCGRLATAIAVARRPHGVLDRLNVAVSMFGFSCPTFLLGLLGIIVFSVNLHWLPATGFVPISAGLGPNIKSIVLPSATVAFGLFCGYTRILRADLVDQMRGEDYIMTARAKGLSQWRILIRHAFRNALFNMITVVVLNIGTLVGGQVLVEQIFAIPGMGLLLISSINNRDIVTVQAEVTLIACAIVAANLLADVLYMVLDPRIRHGRIAS